MIQSLGNFASTSLTIGLLLCAWVPAYGDNPKSSRRRHVALEGQSNFRDIGGYKTKSGETVKWGQVYRSGELPRLTDKDVAKLKQLGIKTVVNFLTEPEIKAHGQDRLPEGTKTVGIPMTGGIAGDLAIKVHKAIDTADFSEVPKDLNLKIHSILIRDVRQEYAAFLKAISDSTNRPVVFHCSHGVHRTGTGAAILLWALGVPWETVREDYLLSNKYRGAEIKKRLAQLRQLAARNQRIAPEKIDMTNINAFYILHGEYIDATRDEILKTYGSIDDYLIKGLGLTKRDIQKLRDRLLE